MENKIQIQIQISLWLDGLNLNYKKRFTIFLKREEKKILE